MKFDVAAVSHPGRVRPGNEDMVLLGELLLRDAAWQGRVDSPAQGPWVALAVADGMGGGNAGEVASQLALELFRDGLGKLPEDGGVIEALQELGGHIHRALHNAGSHRPELRGMGTTFTGLVGRGGHLFVLNAGDSRTYRFRDGILCQLTRDHSLRNQPGFAGAEAHIIVNSFGGGESSYLDVEPAGQPVFEGDVFLICSDGVTDVLDDDRVGELMEAGAGPEDILQEVLKRGAPDNVSCVIARVADVGEGGCDGIR